MPSFRKPLHTLSTDIRQMDLWSNTLPTVEYVAEIHQEAIVERGENNQIHGRPDSIGSGLRPIVARDSHLKIWCGPGALAAVTGLPVEACIQALLQERLSHGDHQPVRGVCLSEITPALSRLGFESTTYPFNAVAPVGKPQPTIATWLKAKPPGVHILLVTRHFLAIAGNVWADNGTRAPRPLSTIRHPRRRVCGYTTITGKTS